MQFCINWKELAIRLTATSASMSTKSQGKEGTLQHSNASPVKSQYVEHPKVSVGIFTLSMTKEKIYKKNNKLTI